MSANWESTPKERLHRLFDVRKTNAGICETTPGLLLMDEWLSAANVLLKEEAESRLTDMVDDTGFVVFLSVVDETLFRRPSGIG